MGFPFVTAGFFCLRPPPRKGWSWEGNEVFVEENGIGVGSQASSLQRHRASGVKAGWWELRGRKGCTVINRLLKGKDREETPVFIICARQGEKNNVGVFTGLFRLSSANGVCEVRILSSLLASKFLIYS